MAVIYDADRPDSWRQAAEQGFGADGTVAGREEGPDAGRVARRDLSPQRGARGYQVPGRSGELAAQAPAPAVRFHLDGDLPAPGHAPAEQHDPAVCRPDHDVIPVAPRQCDPRMAGVGGPGEAKAWRAGE